MSFSQRSTLATSLLLSWLLASCSGGGGSGSGGGGGVKTATNVEETLTRLGVATDSTPRVDDQGNATEDYTPLGTTATLNRTAEILLAGVRVAGDDYQGTLHLWQDWALGAGDARDRMLFVPGADQPWIEEYLPQTIQGTSPQTKRAFAYADCDGNGLDDTIAVHAAADGLRLYTIRDEEGDYAQSDLLFEPGLGADEVALITGDVDGDKCDELILCTADSVALRVAVYSVGPNGPEVDFQTSVVPVLAGTQMTVNLACGNLDTDRLEEFVLTVNETDGLEQNCRYFIHDDAKREFEVLRTGVLEIEGAEGPLALLTSDVAVGDVDGDLIDEVLFAGLSEFTSSCGRAFYVAFALDDASHDFAGIGQFEREFVYSSCSFEVHMRFAHINAGDLDGDGLDEVQLGHFVFDDWFDAAPFTVAWELPTNVILKGAIIAGQYYDRSTSAIAMGDFTGNGRENIACHSQISGELAIFGLEGPSAQATLEEVGTYGTDYTNPETLTNPVLLSPNVDTDSPVLSYDEGEYRLVFTEPIVIAALAAPPYKLGIGQNVEACSTAFGQASSQGESGEDSVNLSSSASLGFKGEAPLGLLEVEITGTVEETVTRTNGWAYETTKTVVYASGYEEDLVIVTCVPVDQYTYTVLSHPEPEMVGRELVISLPRELITLQIDREFYNSSLFPGGMRVDERVFEHEIGAPQTYGGPARKSMLLAEHGGLEKGPSSVGIGSGTTTQEIEVYEEVSEGGALEMGYTAEISTTSGGVVTKYTVGVSESSSLNVTSGESTLYSCTMGAVPGSAFSEHQYLYGMFAYPFRDPTNGREFQVVDYWVE